MGVALAAIAAGAHADQVAGLKVLHRSGQTFVTWTCPPGAGWIYRIYSAPRLLLTSDDLRHSILAGTVGDSTWYDRRLSVLTGTTCAYRIDSLAQPLDPSRGLFVRTVSDRGYLYPYHCNDSYYAVTARHGVYEAEDRTLVPDVNTLTDPVCEGVDRPEPVFQRQLTNRVSAPMIYTLWTTNVGTSLFPAMANVPDVAFDCSVVSSLPLGDNPLLVSLHARGGNFLMANLGTGQPGEWVLGLDDPLWTSDLNTFWYGYNAGYNIYSDLNAPPLQGMVHDYTMQRVIYTLLWAERKFPIDPTRVYAYGFSMGGIGSELLAMRRPDLIAALMTVAAKFDFSFVDDPNPLSGFNLGGGLRQATDRLWGEVGTNLPTTEGASTYQCLNDGWLAGVRAPIALPPLIAFNGKNDTTVGWAEKIPFYRDMRQARQGGYFFWDPRDHLNNANAPWSPATDPRYLYRFRTDRSFPALSNCSADNDPGDGAPTSGDSIGCINCWLEWDTTLVDRNVEWSARLWTRDLPRLDGWITGPESVTVDVTPRRLQQFRVGAGSHYSYTVTRESDGAVVQAGSLTPDGLGLLTIPGAKVYKTGTVIHIEVLGALAVLGGPPASGRIRLALDRNPLGPRTAVEVSWPAAGPARLDLLDVSGRIVRTLLNGPAAAGPVRLPLSTQGLHDGVYFLVASQRGERAVERAVVLK